MLTEKGLAMPENREWFTKMVEASTIDERESNRELLLTCSAVEILNIGMTDYMAGGGEEPLVFLASCIQEKDPRLVEALRDLVDMCESKEDRLIAEIKRLQREHIDRQGQLVNRYTSGMMKLYRENKKLKQQIAEATKPGANE